VPSPPCSSLLKIIAPTTTSLVRVRFLGQHDSATPVHRLASHRLVSCLGAVLAATQAMEPVSVGELREQRRARRAELSTLVHAHALERRCARRVASAAERHWKLTDAVLKIALIIYHMAYGVAEPVVVYLRAEARRRHWPAMDDDDIANLVVSAFYEADCELLIDLTDVDAPSDAGAMRIALDYIEQWRVAKETEGHNLARGVAPSTASVLQRFEERRHALPDAVRPTPSRVERSSEGPPLCVPMEEPLGGSLRSSENARGRPSSAPPEQGALIPACGQLCVRVACGYHAGGQVVERRGATGRLAGWLAAWLASWLVGCLVGWLVGWRACETGRVSVWLVCMLAGMLVGG